MLEIGVDEVGCSSIFGPVSACAVLIDKKDEAKISQAKDSKVLTKKSRNFLINKMKENILCYGIGSAGVQEIAKLNIYWSKFLAMRRAIFSIVSHGYVPDRIIVDGNKEIPELKYPQEAIVKADGLIPSVSTASIIAKVTRDSLLEDLEKNIRKYSYYDISNNAGYFSLRHMKGIIKHGFTDLHRREFVYSQFCISLHKEFSNSDLTSVDDWLEFAYGDKIDLEDDWALYKYWKVKREMKLKNLGWD